MITGPVFPRPAFMQPRPPSRKQQKLLDQSPAAVAARERAEVRRAKKRQRNLATLGDK